MRPLALLVAVLLLVACPRGPQPQPLPSETRTAAVIAALEGAAQVADWSAVASLSLAPTPSLPACVASRSVAQALRIAVRSVAQPEGPEIPGATLDASMCLAAGVVVDTDVPVEVEAAVRGGVGLARAILVALAPEIRPQDCRGYAWGLAALDYAAGVIGPVLDEVRDPDGLVEVPAVSVDLSWCDDAVAEE